MATRKKNIEPEAEIETKELEVKDAPVLDPIAAATAAVAAMQSGGGSGELEVYSAGKLIDSGNKVYLQSDLDDLQAQIDWLNRKNLFTFYSGAASHAVAFEPGGAFIVFITWGSACNFYFVNSGTTTAYSKTLIDQMENDITVTRDGLTYTYASTAGHSLSVFVKRMN